MKLKITLCITVIFMLASFSFVVNAQSSAKVDYANQSIRAGVSNYVSTSFRSPDRKTVNIQLQLLSKSGKLIEEWTRSNSGTNGGEAFKVFWPKIPKNVIGSGYRWHFQMFNSDWSKKLAGSYYSRTITINAAPPPSGRNDEITNFNPTRKTFAGKTENLNFRYITAGPGRVWVQTRLLSKYGSVLSEVTSVEAGTALGRNLTARLKVPSDLSSGKEYKWNVQLFTYDWKKVLASNTISNITVGGRTNLKAQLPLESINEERTVVKELTVSPNPFTNSFKYDFTGVGEGDVKIELYALDGRKVKSLKVVENHQAVNYSDFVDASNLDAGIYLLKVSTPKGVQAKKIIKD